MLPDEIKGKVQGAHVRAMENRNVWKQRSSGIQDLFRTGGLYGRDAGIDFVETHLERIVQEAVETAGCKSSSLDITAYGFGRAALEGMAQTLRERTALKVEVAGSVLKLIWAQETPGLV